MDTEIKYLALQGEEELSSKRREAFMGFLHARAAMLSITIKKTMESQVDGTTQAEQTNRQVTENRSISFDHADTLCGKSEGETTQEAKLKAGENVADYIADEISFRFETSMVSKPMILYFASSASQSFLTLCAVWCPEL